MLLLEMCTPLNRGQVYIEHLLNFLSISLANDTIGVPLQPQVMHDHTLMRFDCININLLSTIMSQI